MQHIHLSTLEPIYKTLHYTCYTNLTERNKWWLQLIPLQYHFTFFSLIVQIFWSNHQSQHLLLLLSFPPPRNSQGQGVCCWGQLGGQGKHPDWTLRGEGADCEPVSWGPPLANHCRTAARCRGVGLNGRGQRILLLLSLLMGASVVEEEDTSHPALKNIHVLIIKHRKCIYWYKGLCAVVCISSPQI